MKVIWNLENEVAIPTNQITSFQIATIDDWSQKSKEGWRGGRYYVIARYAITGNDFVFTSDSKGDCIRFIECI